MDFSPVFGEIDRSSEFKCVYWFVHRVHKDSARTGYHSPAVRAYCKTPRLAEQVVIRHPEAHRPRLDQTKSSCSQGAQHGDTVPLALTDSCNATRKGGWVFLPGPAGLGRGFDGFQPSLHLTIAGQPIRVRDECFTAVEPDPDPSQYRRVVFISCH
jgi:hypothetical protein